MQAIPIFSIYSVAKYTHEFVIQSSSYKPLLFLLITHQYHMSSVRLEANHDKTLIHLTLYEMAYKLWL